jgi:hypothetical protein
METFVGITHGLPNDFNVHLAVIHPDNRNIAQGSWSIETGSYSPLETVDGTTTISRHPHAYPAAFEEIATFLGSHCGASTRILIDYPAGDTTRDSVFVQFVVSLLRNGFGTFVIDTYDADEATVRLRETPPEQKPPTVKDEIGFLANGKAKAYAMFLTEADNCASLTVALAGALIAANPYLHFYLKTAGQVFSSQDIALFLKDPEAFNPVVVTDSGVVYFLSATPQTSRSDLPDLHLDYQLACKKFAFLPAGEALKFALLSVCKGWGLRLHCLSSSDPRADKLLDEEPLGPDECVVYDPSSPLPSWIADRLRQ